MAGEMNGAESLVRTLIAGGVNVCFTNPGTSEMHFVAALDKVPGMRCVLGLFEGVVTGAADGYYRMLGRAGLHPAASGPRPRQRARQPAQRQEGELRHRQHRRRARHLSHRLRRSVDLRHRGRGGAHVALGQDFAQLAHHRGRWGSGDRSGAANAWADRDLDPARGHGLGCGRRHRRDQRRLRLPPRSRRLPSRRPPPCCAAASEQPC